MTYYFIFSKTALLLQRQTDGTHTIPCTEEVPVKTHPWTHIMNITPMEDGTAVKTFNIEDPEHLEILNGELKASGYDFIGLRESFYHLPVELYLKAGKCQELLYWDHNTQFCGVCGAPMKMHTDISKRCTQCGKEVWPQLATAIIVLIHKGDEVLLVHAKNFKGDFYGLVAGFVETGETLEEAVAS
jgi:NAD+ diphosphatase